jgi:copper chaperone CopZ
MKNLKSLLSSTLIFASYILMPQPAEAKVSPDTVVVKVSSVCGMCAETIEKALAYEKGVMSTMVDGKKQLATVVYNPKKTSEEKIKKAITLSGYDADEMKADKRAFDRLDECCKIDRNEIH